MLTIGKNVLVKENCNNKVFIEEVGGDVFHPTNSTMESLEAAKNKIKN